MCIVGSASRTHKGLQVVGVEYRSGYLNTVVVLLKVMY